MKTTNANNILDQECQKNWFDVFVRSDSNQREQKPNTIIWAGKGGM